MLLLKRKLEKSDLKNLIHEIKAYKEQGAIEPLLTLLKEWFLKNIISKEDMDKFRPFVRKDDERAFTELLGFNIL